MELRDLGRLLVISARVDADDVATLLRPLEPASLWTDVSPDTDFRDPARRPSRPPGLRGGDPALPHAAAAHRHRTRGWRLTRVREPVGQRPQSGRVRSVTEARVVSVEVA